MDFMYYIVFEAALPRGAGYARISTTISRSTPFAPETIDECRDWAKGQFGPAPFGFEWNPMMVFVYDFPTNPPVVRQ